MDDGRAPFGMHPDIKVPGIEMSTGGLGHGLSVGVGMALGARIKGQSFHTYVMIGDGDIPLRRLVRTLDAAGYRGWYDIELLGPAIEAAGYEAVVPLALARFRELWT